jgi:diguanylate cyclase (GGDEF)-like protein
MARLSSGDRPERSTNGMIKRLQDSLASGGLGGRLRLADSEQTLGDSDQTLADSDQTSGERDQTSADSDQAASDRDQAASDRDLAHGVDPRAHEASRDIRRRTALERELSAATRLVSAHERDATAAARDLAALARDRAAAARDLAMAQRDADYERDGGRAVTGAEIVMRAAQQRKRARDYRVQAAEHRAQAARDREAAATDREQGARDRLQALADREALARALAITEIDPLTGARTRAAGLTDLDHELDRGRRTGSTLVIAYVDAVGLKRLNDSEGHDAGDRLLKRVVALITEHLRPYDLIVRLAGDEFLCAMSNMTLHDARRRFSAIAGALAATSEAGALRTGFAELAGDETATELIARADSQLIHSRPDTDAPRRATD